MSRTSLYANTRRLRPMHHALAAAVLAALQSGAWAQTTSAGQLQTVQVTAERRLENIRDVPSSVSALQGEMLETINSGGQDIRMLAGRVPSLNIESSFGRAFPRFYIRGIGNTDFDLNASQPVSLVFDDVVQENPILKGFPIFDLERIEVLRGPQGTLFGRNSPAGVVKFESAKPGKKFEGYGTLSVGRYSMFNAEGAVNVPLGEGTALRVSLQSQNRGDWVDNTHDAGPTQELEGYHDNAARVQLLVAPMKSLSVLLGVHTRDLKGSARLFRANIIQPGSNNLVAGFDPAKVSYDGVNKQDVSNTGGSVRVRYDMGGMALSSITGYETVDSFSRGDIDGGFGASFLGAGNYGPGFIPFDAESADGLPKHHQLTQEFRLESTGSGALQWLAGVYYFDEQINIDSFNYSSIGGNTQNGYATQQQDNTAYAAFGSVNLAVSDKLKLRGGLRYTKDKKDFVADRIQAPPFSPTFIGRRTAHTNATNTSGDFSATYAVADAVNVYGRVATGFRAPSIQGRLLFGDTLSVAKSEKVTSYEAGVKADLFNRRARTSFSVFSYTIKDQQLTAVGGAANFNQLVNAAKTVGNGAEFDLQVLATDSLLFTLGGSINNTKIKDAGLLVDACGSGCTVLDPVVRPANPGAGKFSPTVSIDGNPLPQAPKLTLNFSARYAFAVAGGEMFVLTDWFYRSKINFFLYESAEYTGKALAEGGVRLGYSFGGGKYEAAAFVRNITNQVRVVGGIDFNNLTGFINEPRTFGASFKANFYGDVSTAMCMQRWSLFAAAIAAAAASTLAAAQPAVIYELGGKFDRSFNQAAYQGAELWKQQTGKPYLEFEVQNAAQREQAARRFATRGANPIVGIGFPQASAIEAVAKDFPKLRFAIIDMVVALPNVQSFVYREHEGSFLVGMMAALASKTGKVGFVGGMDIPLVRKFLCGYQQGARYAVPRIEVISSMTGSTPAAWTDPARGAELTKAQIAQGVDVVFAAAGTTGLGIMQAAKDAGKLSIGVDSNQNHLHPGSVLTSMVKRVDLAVLQAFNGVQPGVTALGLKEGGVDVAMDEHNARLVPPEMKRAVDAARAEIVAGRLLVIDYTVANACR